MAVFKMPSVGSQFPIILTRDSVCAGDDADAPHEKRIEVSAAVETVAFVTAISAGYLPSVAGVGHSWTCVFNGTAIAHLSAAGVRVLTPELPFSQENHVHFRYQSAPY